MKAVKKIKVKNKHTVYFVADTESNGFATRDEFNAYVEQMMLPNFSEATNKTGGIFGTLKLGPLKKGDGYIPAQIKTFKYPSQLLNYYIKVAGQKHVKEVVVFFHNLKFDMCYLMEAVIRRLCYRRELATPHVNGRLEYSQQKADLKEQIKQAVREKKNVLTSFIPKSNYKSANFLSLTIGIYGVGKIVFRDTLAMFNGQSEQSLAVAIGAPPGKDNFDYSIVRTYDDWINIPENWEYFSNDLIWYAKIMRDKRLKLIYGHGKNVTAGSYVGKRMSDAAIAYSKKVGLLEPILIDDIKKGDPKINGDDLAESMRGGLTINNTNLKGADGYMLSDEFDEYDINSAYPNVMREPLPTRRSYEKCYGKDCRHLLGIHIIIAIPKMEIIDKVGTGIINLEKIKVLGDELPDYHYEPRTVEFAEVCVGEQEFEYYKKGYDMEYKVVRTLHVEVKHAYLKDFVEANYERRLNAKKFGNDALQFALKILSNVCYGQFAMVPKSRQLELTNDPKRTERHRNSYSYGFNGDVSEGVASLCDELKGGRDILTASGITMRVRCKLLDGVLQAGKNFIGSDTDSIKVKSGVKLALPLSEKLGDGKVSTGQNIKIIAPKRYLSLVYVNGDYEFKAKVAGQKVASVEKIFNKSNVGPRGNRWCNSLIAFADFNETNLSLTPDVKTFRTRYGRNFVHRSLGGFKTVCEKSGCFGGKCKVDLNKFKLI